MSQEKTEKPTDKKLKDERKKGNVPSSKDFSKAAVFLAFVLYIAVMGGDLFEDGAELIVWAGAHATEPFAVTLSAFVELAMRYLVTELIPFLIIILLVGTLSEFLNHGAVFAPEKIKPKLENVLGMLKKIQQWFALRNLLEFFKAILKVTLLSIALWWVVMENLNGILLSPGGGVMAVIKMTGKLILTLMIITAIIFIIFAVIDLILQRLVFMREQRMSKDEVTREHKESEGDPHFKQHRKTMQREIVNGTQQPVKNATAVVTNPIHFAVALRYVQGETLLPIVLIKGAGESAAAIVKEARSYQIPIVENVPLARALMADADEDDYVPQHLLMAVAELLRAVFDAAADGGMSDISHLDDDLDRPYDASEMGYSEHQSKAPPSYD
ncbi:MAG: EscU/YscU/HrcU family type III secretion system export apparatus switch protein [Pseudomonadota bacterium]